MLRLTESVQKRAVCSRGRKKIRNGGPMRYDTILYDLDNTLLDFNVSQKRAFFRAFPGRD